MWNVYRLNGILGVSLVDDPLPVGAELLGLTSDPDYLANVANAEAAANPPRLVTKLAFRRRFTLAERIAMDSAPDNPAIAPATRAALHTLAKDLELAEEIDLDDADVIAGLALLESLEIIAAGRAAEVRA